MDIKQKILAKKVELDNKNKELSIKPISLKERIMRKIRRYAVAIVITEMIIVAVAGLTAPQIIWVYGKLTAENKRVIEISNVEEIKEVEDPQMKERAELRKIIFTLESSKGVNNYSKCKEQGKFNRTGQAIDGSGDYICFDTEEEEMLELDNYIKRRQAEGFSRREILCYYNKGQKTENCKYAEDAKLVKL